MGKHSQTFLSVFLLSLSLCNNPPSYRFLSVHSCSKLQKLMLSSHSLWHNKNLIYIIKISHTKLLFSLCTPGDVKHSQTFLSLSLSLQNLCNLPQRKVVSTQLQNSKTPNGLQRVPTGYNGLERVPTSPNGFERGGEEERSMTRFIISPILQ
jgi:hypothetical protein